MRERHLFVLRYALFAAIAGLANLLAQAGAAHLLGGRALLVPLAAGTAVGFAAKYLLDKFWIFADPFAGHKEEARKIATYGAFSVVTTLIFWGSELAAWFVFRTLVARYAGAVIGLILGNWLKYRLDRRWVFRVGQ